MKIFITGTSSGIGLGLAKLLSDEGHEVWGVARREMKSVKYRYSVCDITDHAQVSKVMAEMEEAKFLPDVVVLGSAILPKDLEGSFDYEKSAQGFATNYDGALIWVSKLLPKFLERKSGKFIAVSSTSAKRPDIKSVGLPASKAALSMAFRSLRLRYRPDNIKFSTVFFGPVATPVIPEFTTKDGGKKFFFVLSAAKAAKLLKKAIFGNRDKYYFPFLFTCIFRLTLWIPDRIYSKISSKLKS
ncbi:hypothetical protein CL622_06120 [archaeon]|nr:hypothetical protein [archaeon]|tara:strand:- start:1165 stop:1893 length:729 start_codon:yes stop_codon:yes gene_type:complete